MLLNVDKLRIDLRAYLKENKISIRKFGEMSGISPSIISRILSGDYNPGVKIATKIFNVIDYPVYDDMSSFRDLTIVELNTLIDKLTIIRDKKYEIIKLMSEVNDLYGDIHNI